MNCVADHPNPDDVGVSDTESVGGASSAGASEEALDVVEPSLVLRDVRVNCREMRAALVALDAADLGTMFARRAVVMKSVPHFLRGACRGAMRIAMEEATQPDSHRSERGWKLFLAQTWKGWQHLQDQIDKSFRRLLCGALGCVDFCQRGLRHWSNHRPSQEETPSAA